MTANRPTTQTRRRGGWTPRAKSELARIQAVLEALAEYWPLTLRQVYYQLVAAGLIENCRAQYTKLSRLLAKARLHGLVPWDAIEDRARTTLESAGWPDRETFINTKVGGFLKGYRRDLLQGQSIVPEIWIEKDALSRITHGVALQYCVPVLVGRGFSSVSYLHEARDRIHRRAKAGQITRILYFGDLDPSGRAMLPTMMETLTREMDCEGLVEARHCALTPEQVEAYSLPTSLNALKESDTRAAKYREQFGDLAVELDALPPPDLEAIVKASIRETLDLSELEAEREREVADGDALATLREGVLETVRAET